MLLEPGQLVETKAGKEFGDRGGINKLPLLLILLRPGLSWHQALHLHHVDELEPSYLALAFAQPGARGVLKKKDFQLELL